MTAACLQMLNEDIALLKRPFYFTTVKVIAFLSADSHEDFPSVPKVHPSLGLKAGHDRRDIAAARKPRPPTRKTTATQQQVSWCIVYIIQQVYCVKGN